MRSQLVTVPARLSASDPDDAQRSATGDRGPPRLSWNELGDEARERLTRYLEAGARREHPGRAIHVEHEATR